MATKYQPLVDHLAAQTGDAVTLTFAEIEAILGMPLNEPMRINASMWDGAHHAYVLAWEAAGWVAALDRHNGCVFFTRDTGGE